MSFLAKESPNFGRSLCLLAETLHFDCNYQNGIKNGKPSALNLECFDTMMSST